MVIRMCFWRLSCSSLPSVGLPVLHQAFLNLQHPWGCCCSLSPWPSPRLCYPMVKPSAAPFSCSETGKKLSCDCGGSVSTQPHRHLPNKGVSKSPRDCDNCWTGTSRRAQHEQGWLIPGASLLKKQFRAIASHQLINSGLLLRKAHCRKSQEPRFL